MAKTSSIQRNSKKKRLAASQFPKRIALKKIIMDRSVSGEDRFQAVLKLAQFPRNGATNRVRNICELTGRSRGNYRKFKLSRIIFRDMSSDGLIPGVTKASW